MSFQGPPDAYAQGPPIPPLPGAKCDPRKGRPCGADSEGSNGRGGSCQTGCPEFPGDPQGLCCPRLPGHPQCWKECETFMLPRSRAKEVKDAPEVLTCELATRETGNPEGPAGPSSRDVRA